MDWSRAFQFSLPDVRGLVSRRTVILALMAVLIYQGVGIFYKTLALQLIRMRPAPTVEKVQAAAVPVREPADAYRVIPERNLFGTTAKSTTEKAAPAAQQDVALLFELRGTVAGEGKYGFAVVEEKGTRKQRLVKAGDVLAGGRVVRIRRNEVDLLVDDQARTLKIIERKESPIAPPPPVAASLPPPPASPGVALVVNRSEIGTALQDMGSMLSQAQIRPFFNAGVPDGFMISNIRPGSLYQRMGIVDGDIIQGVNNRKIQTADDMAGLFNVLKSDPEMSLSIRRRGSQQTLNYQFR